MTRKSHSWSFVWSFVLDAGCLTWIGHSFVYSFAARYCALNALVHSRMYSSGS